MVITSKNKWNVALPFRSAQLRYALVYVLITSAVLLFLNVYSSETSQTLFYQSKQASMIEKCHMTAADISELEVINPATVASVVSRMSTLKVTRLVITDRGGLVIYDSLSEDNLQGRYALFPEVVEALRGHNSFTWLYHDGDMRSMAACPFLSYGTLSGCVYMMEYDPAQGALFQSLQNNILSATLILGAAVILFSVFFATAFTKRLRKIFASMRIIREGDYSHKVVMGGHDELAVLGREFNDLTERLQISENKRRQFVSDASHELKTPLASIKLLSDSILQNDMDMDTIREFVGDIGNEADRLNRMSQKLLSLSRIETQSDGELEIIDMAPTVLRVSRMLGAIARENDISIFLDLDENCPILIPEDDLYQITFNLVENGIKYNAPGGTLEISLHRDGDDAVLKVRDTGVGIPEDSIDHVFERFYRVDKARSRKSGGSGLGLAIVKTMVLRNGGSIHVDSVLGKDTVFTVTFPIFDTEEVSE